MAAFVYMLRCADSSYYVGSTRGSLEQRVAEHHAGSFAGYTASRLPVVLVWSQEFGSITDAIAMERRVKDWSRAKQAAIRSEDHTSENTSLMRNNYAIYR